MPDSRHADQISDLAPIGLLRAELKKRGLDGFVVPRSDEHQGEYVPPSAQRLLWLTSFSGSAGAAVVLTDRAALFVDGRYTLQAQAEVDSALFELRHLIDQPLHLWLGDALQSGQKLGYDPWLHTPNGVDQLRKACDKVGASLIACRDNPLDAAWIDQPDAPDAPFVAYPLHYAGKPAAEKRAEVAAKLVEAKVEAAFLSAPDSIAWLLNIRGADVPYAPLPLAFALLHADASVDLFVNPAKVPSAVLTELGEDVRVAEPVRMGAALDRLKGKAVRLDPASAPSWVLDRLVDGHAVIDRGADPCALPKACKNDVELDGMRAAHLRDGVAITRFLCWLEKAALEEDVDEIAAADVLELLRQQGEHYCGPSFPTIAGAGPNGAIVHYRSTPETNRRLEAGQLFLLDSGGQYLDGTTDITRTVAIGKAGAEERRRFTLVLKGHIALASTLFPQGTTGSQLDALARRALWADGLDYDHGTGHGVGSYLSVHEGPQRISKMPSPQALLPGMVLSNEPGYYQAGAYGIRIENLLVVNPATQSHGRAMLGFDVLTLAPIDLSLVDVGLLGPEEKAWLNAYHDHVRRTLSPLLESEVAIWLEDACRRI